MGRRNHTDSAYSTFDATTTRSVEIPNMRTRRTMRTSSAICEEQHRCHYGTVALSPEVEPRVGAIRILHPSRSASNPVEHM